MRADRAGEWAHPDFPFGQYSDDTQLARELVLSFVDARGWSPDAFARRLSALFAEGKDVGAGPGTRGAAMRLLSGVHWSQSGTPAPYAGNGSAMRAAPLGLLFGADTRAMAEAVMEQSVMTHLDPRCAAGGLAVAGAVSLASARQPIDADRFLDRVAGLAATADQSVARAIRGLGRWIRLPPAEAARSLHAAGLEPASKEEWRGISAFVTSSVVWSLYAFLHTPDDYWATICTAIEVSGDTDTMAAIGGAISGARLGATVLPATLVQQLNDRGEWGRDSLMDLAQRAARLVRR